MEKQADDLEGLAKTSGKAIEKQSDVASKPKDPASTAETYKPAEQTATEDVPDPDEDDLDDLDGKLFH